MNFFVLLLINLAITVVMELLRPSMKDRTKPAGLADFDFPTATEDRSLPVIFGTVKIAPNVTWYGDFRATKLTEKVKTGMFKKDNVTIGFQYSVGMELAICDEVIDSLREVWVDKRKVWEGVQDLTYTSGPATLEIYDTWKAHGSKVPNGVDVCLELNGTRTTTEPSPYLVSILGSGNVPAHRGQTVIVWKGPSYQRIKTVRKITEPGSAPTGQLLDSGWLSNSPQVPPVYFVVRRLPYLFDKYPFMYWDPDDINDTLEVNGDANPAWLLVETLLNKKWGCGLYSGWLDITSFYEAAQVLHAEGNGMSFAWQTASAVREIIEMVCKQTNGILQRDAITGKFQFRLIRNTDAISMTLDESNIERLESFSRVAMDEAVNEVKVRYPDRELNFDPRVAIASNPATLRAEGAVISEEYEYGGVSRAGLASILAMRELRALSSPLAKASVTAVIPPGTILRPGDAVLLDWPPLEIVDLRMRIASIAYNERMTGARIELVQDIFNPGSEYYNNPGAGTGTPTTSDPEPIVDQGLMQAPYGILNSTTDSDYLLHYAMQPESLGTTGYVLSYKDTGSFFERQSRRPDIECSAIGTIGSAIGLTEDFSSVTVTVDSFNKFAVAQTLPESVFLIIGDEWIYSDSITISGTTVIFEGIQRAVFDTIPAAHAAGSTCLILLDYAIDEVALKTKVAATIGGGYVVDLPGYPGTTARAIATGASGPLYNETAPTVSFTEDEATHRVARPYPPGCVMVNGEVGGDSASPGAAIGSTGTVTFVHRNRKNKSLSPWFEGDSTHETGCKTVVVIERWDGAAWVTDVDEAYRTGGLIDYVYTPEDGTGPWDIRVTMWSRFDYAGGKTLDSAKQTYYWTLTP